MDECGRGPGAFRLGVGFALLLAFAACAPRAWGGKPSERPLPANAVQPPGASFEHDPDVERFQWMQVVREVLRASCRATARAPVRSFVLNASRLTERLSVRAVELRPASPSRLGNLGRKGHEKGPGGELGGGAGGPLTETRLTFLPDSETAIQALLREIASARGRIDLMMYGWQDDPTGREVAAALAARARQGVRVRLLVDRTGFLIHNPEAARGHPTFLDALKAEPNVSLIEPPGTFFRFDHRKLAVFDDRVAWTGGMILTESARRRWRNFSVRVEGPVVASYVHLFTERWRELGGAPAGPAPAPPPVTPNARVRLVRTDLDERSLKEAVYHAADHARRSLFLENPYFSDEILTRKLVAAKARGVDVRAVLTLRGNIHTMNKFETMTANRLLRGGVRVYLYPAMTHVKAMSVDGAWCYLGTGNFDELSLRNNREVALSIPTPAVAQALDRTLFLPDMAASQELTQLLPPPRKRLRLLAFSLWF